MIYLIDKKYEDFIGDIPEKFWVICALNKNGLWINQEGYQGLSTIVGNVDCIATEPSTVRVFSIHNRYSDPTSIGMLSNAATVLSKYFDIKIRAAIVGIDESLFGCKTFLGLDWNKRRFAMNLIIDPKLLYHNVHDTDLKTWLQGIYKEEL